MLDLIAVVIVLEITLGFLISIVPADISTLYEDLKTGFEWQLDKRNFIGKIVITIIYIIGIPMYIMILVCKLFGATVIKINSMLMK